MAFRHEKRERCVEDANGKWQLKIVYAMERLGELEVAERLRATLGINNNFNISAFPLRAYREWLDEMMDEIKERDRLRPPADIRLTVSTGREKL